VTTGLKCHRSWECCAVERSWNIAATPCVINKFVISIIIESCSRAQDVAVGLSWREETELRKALYASMQKQKQHHREKDDQQVHGALPADGGASCCSCIVYFPSTTYCFYSRCLLFSFYCTFINTILRVLLSLCLSARWQCPQHQNVVVESSHHRHISAFVASEVQHVKCIVCYISWNSCGLEH